MSVAEIVFPDDVSVRLRSATNGRGVTVEHFIAESVEMRLDADRQVELIDARAARADREAAIKLVRNAPDVPAEEGYEMPGDGHASTMGR